MFSSCSFAGGKIHKQVEEQWRAGVALLSEQEGCGCHCCGVADRRCWALATCLFLLEDHEDFEIEMLVGVCARILVQGTWVVSRNFKFVPQARNLSVPSLARRQSRNRVPPNERKIQFQKRSNTREPKYAFKATRSKSSGEVEPLCFPSKKDAAAMAHAESQTDAALERLLD